MIKNIEQNNMHFKITWEEVGDENDPCGVRIVSDCDIKKVAFGKDYVKYEYVLSLESLVDFLNFQQNRKIPSTTKVLSINVATDKEIKNLKKKKEIKRPDIEQNNELFQLTHNKKEKCHDFILKKASYDTTTELAGMMSWLHQLGVNMPEVKIRLGAQVEKDIVVDAKPKIVV